MKFVLSLHQRTPLYMAAKGGCLEIIKCLVDLNADINIKDRAMVGVYVAMVGVYITIVLRVQYCC